MTFDYDSWVSTQAETVERELRRGAQRGVMRQCLYLVPTDGKRAGFLKVSGGAETLRAARLGPHTNLATCPYSHLRSLIWEACRSLPIIPTGGA